MTAVQASGASDVSIADARTRPGSAASDTGPILGPKKVGFDELDLASGDIRGRRGARLLGGPGGPGQGGPGPGRGSSTGMLQIQGRTQPKDVKRILEGLAAYDADHAVLQARALELEQGDPDPEEAYRIAKKLDTAFHRLLTRVENRFVGPEERKRVMDALDRKQDLSWRLYQIYDPDQVGGPLSTVKANEKGQSIPFARQLTGVTRFLQEPSRVFAAIFALEREVMTRAMDDGIKMKDAREAVLAESEAAHGFEPVVTLEDKAYSAKAWHAMLRQGALFRDVTFNDKARRGRPHAEDSHRLQWHMILRDVVADPAAYGVKVQVREGGIHVEADGRSHRVADWFKATGHEASAKVSSDDGEPNSLWGHLFDSFEENFTSPEAFRRRHPFMSGIGRWV